jgi:U3 small nucleolar RNA-associated protein 18
MAVGAESGVVNLYENSLSEESYIGKRSPIKRIMNLKTSVDFAKFNHNGEILAMSTRREKDGLKLFHTKSRTVFSNWPTSKTPLGYVWSLDFSPGSKFMAIGNDKGKCLLYKLNHYHDS